MENPSLSTALMCDENWIPLAAKINDVLAYLLRRTEAAATGNGNAVAAALEIESRGPMNLMAPSGQAALNGPSPGLSLCRTDLLPRELEIMPGLSCSRAPDRLEARSPTAADETAEGDTQAETESSGLGRNSQLSTRGSQGCSREFVRSAATPPLELLPAHAASGSPVVSGDEREGELSNKDAPIPTASVGGTSLMEIGATAKGWLSADS